MTAMTVRERSEAIARANRALKALGEHPHSSIRELGRAREHVNACYSDGSGEHVRNAVAQVEAMAERRFGVPTANEQRRGDETSADLEEPATTSRGRHAEDREIPSLSPAAVIDPVGGDPAPSPAR